MLWLEGLLDTCGALLLLPVCVLFAEVLFAVIRRPARSVQQPGDRGRVAILVPGHDEALVIKESLRSLIPQLTTSDRLLVVADNCSDGTAAIAREEGAEVIERTDLACRGKGYALDFGIRYLERNPPDVVIIVDADCRVTAGAIDRLSRECARTGRPAQALYLMHAPREAGLKTRVAQLAWIVKNQVRPTGLHHLGLPCQLMGTGMAFPWSCIRSARLASGHIVEDLKLGIEMALAGTPARFCPGALVTSDFPESSEGIHEQRKRWEHGHLSMILSEAPRLFLESLRSFNVDSMTLALDLTVPPVALLALQVVVIWCLAALLFAFTKVNSPLEIATIAGALLASSVLLSWASYGRHIMSLRSLSFATVYALWKVPLYVRFVIARQADWVRSKRDDHPRGQ